MFTFYKSNHLTRRFVLALLLAVSLVITMLPNVALAAPAVGSRNDRYASGQRMSGGACVSYVLVHRGETLSGIAARWGVSLWALRDTNGISNPNRIYVGQRLCIPRDARPHGGHPGGYGDHGNVYSVRPGDTLSGIAMRFGTSVWWLMQTNHIPNPNRIYTGQILRIR